MSEKMSLEKLNILELAKLLREKKISALELSNYFLERIERYNSKLKACWQVFAEEARLSAALADQRLAQGEKNPLLGIPYLLSDNILVKNKKTTAGSKFLEDYLAPYDATIIKKLKNEGAVLLGKTAVDEFGLGFSTENTIFPASQNPWQAGRVPGGSAGGAASAISAGLAVFALGLDSGGSVRQPANFCGVLGLRTTYGSVSRFGTIPFSSSANAVGIFSRQALDASLVLEKIAGQDDFDLRTFSSEEKKKLINKRSRKNNLPLKRKDLKKIKIGFSSEFLPSKLDREIKEAFLKSLDFFQEEGAELLELDLPYYQEANLAYYVISLAEFSSNLNRLDGIRFGHALKYKSKKGTEDNLKEIYLKNRGQGFSSETKKNLILGTYFLSSEQFSSYYKKAMALQNKIKQEFKMIWEKVDIIMTPSSLFPAPLAGVYEQDPLKFFLESYFLDGPALLGTTALSLPIGFNQEGLPLGAQIFADKFQDDLILNLAQIYQEKTSFHQKYPQL